MADETRSFGPEILFSWYDASTWLDGYLFDMDNQDWEVKELEIKLMPSGGYRSFVSFVRKDA